MTYIKSFFSVRIVSYLKLISEVHNRGSHVTYDVVFQFYSNAEYSHGVKVSYCSIYRHNCI